MPELFLHGRSLQSVFELLGAKENDITYSIAWTLSRSDGFLGRFLEHVFPGHNKRNCSDVVLSIQEHSKNGGFTDIELKTPEEHLIIEAKRGWSVTNGVQLRKYIPRFKKHKIAHPLLVSMSEASEDFVRLRLPDKIEGIPVVHVPYSKVVELCDGKASSHAEKRILSELHNYLNRIVPMQNQESNWVYVVALNRYDWAPGLNFIQVVQDRDMYFHPFGSGGWPKEAPNYLGFRYDGRLQAIRHVESAKIITNFHPHFPEQHDKETGPHVLYKLGPAIIPQTTIKTGKIFRNGRRWAMLDLLLTSKTIADASAKSYKRVD